ncbi:chorismate--pyruvate lyase family protein [Methylomonas koyamae]|uniref:chorismate--pyruvate lyase family protein n=1 Tax=Methylomonas koyamae TaxID=702114 RepID=UPI00112CA064|nr:chorismate lyase [Methylomonas koyamae]TPQ29665.1 chorismate lyase [Methylomonas koyamae]
MPDKSFLFKRPPLWSAHETAAQRQLAPELQSWLNETGSLTRRLRGIYGNRFGVELLFHRWKPAFNDECRLLALPPARYQLIREVLLHADGRPLVLARTVLPDPTIKIAHRNLSHLGNRPLGEVIFAYPDLERRRRQFSRAEPNQWSTAVQTRLSMAGPTWGRRTEYAIHGHPLLVAEFFLPALLQKV